MHTFCYLGRPDGLGNRLEEIVKLELICQKAGATCQYLWNNKIKNRSYGVFLSAENVDIVVADRCPYPEKTFSDFETCFSQDEMIAAAKKIKPTFDISFEDHIRPVGVHIRASDRIGKDHPHFMRGEQELKSYLSETIFVINKQKPKYVYVCSESTRCKNVFLKYLDKDINICSPKHTKQTPPEYVDFFALSLCCEVWMVSRFSTFSIMASLIGNAPLMSFTADKEMRERYLAKFRYHRCHNRKIVKENLLGWKKMSLIRGAIKAITKRQM